VAVSIATCLGVAVDDTVLDRGTAPTMDAVGESRPASPGSMLFRRARNGGDRQPEVPESMRQILV